MDLIKRNLFWIAVGLIALASVAALAGLAVPAIAANNRRASELSEKARAFTQSAQKPSMPNQHWIEKALAEQKIYGEQWDKVLEFLQEQDKYLEQPFEGAEDAGTWKYIYKEKMDQLEKEIAEGFVQVAANPIVRKSYADAWPQKDEMAWETKNYWIQKYIIDVFLELNRTGSRPVVPVFGRFRFSAQPERLLRPVDQDVFRPVAFQIQFAAEFPNIPAVIAGLLNKKEVSIFITSMSLERWTGGGGAASGVFGASAGSGPLVTTGPYGRVPGSGATAVGPGGVAAAGRTPQPALPANLVRVTLDGYVADFVGQQPAAAVKP